MDTTMLISLLERLGWTSLQTVLLVALVYGLCRALPSLSASTRCRLWWLVSLQAVLGLFWSQPLQLAWLPAPQDVAMSATDLAADAIHPMAPELSANLLATAPINQAPDIAASIGSGVSPMAWWALALAALWLSGVLVMAWRTFGEWRQCRALLAASHPCEDAALVQALQLAADAHGLRRAPRLWMSEQVDAPQLVGPLRPVLLLPAGANALQGDALDLALTHELQHLQRRDLQWGLLPALAQHLFFFHPLLRMAVREYAQAREEAVDAAVVGQHGASRHAYGRLLLQLGVAPAPHLGVASAAPSTTSLKRRLMSLQPRRACPRILAIGLTALVVAVGVAPMRLVAAPAPPAPPAPPKVVPAPLAPPAAPAVPASAAHVVMPPPPAAPAAPAAPPAPPAPPVDDEDGDDSYTTVGELHLGNDMERGHVLIDHGRSYASATIDDIKQARRDVGREGPVLWFREGNKRYAVRDPALIQPLQRVYAQSAEVGRQQGELGREQGALGRQQGELGRKQAVHAREIARVATQAASKAVRATDINREAAAEAARATRGVTDDAAIARAADAEVRRAMQDLQDTHSRDISELADQQAQLGLRQSALGSRQAELGERQAQLQAQASAQVKQVIARAMASGKAQQL
ncbi:transmembrane BlaR protein [Stenotrophomonas sp. S48]|uniref:M56 family metallopeptidase n=1 Tax=unclassified Stenotrophomonas TaxID=196198 RepID=UPI0018FF1FE3|nr:MULTISPECIES: M56 family metallopeptidase [unclassified Stenotrophomonas]MBK0025493.1 transmembrane BlaR protein [Stenotrophomonas sp. S48]MBK0047528.1 transmembrane BlaR protein [Stenotrophomonas sp. S49]